LVDIAPVIEENASQAFLNRNGKASRHQFY
jgi:hypothetical protein